MITENLSTLKIHKLTQEQYNGALESGNVDSQAIYLTPDTPLIVTATRTEEQEANKQFTASHTGPAIWDCIQQGRAVYFKPYGDNDLYSLTNASEDTATFVYVTGNSLVGAYYINIDGVGEAHEYNLTTQDLDMDAIVAAVIAALPNGDEVAY